MREEEPSTFPALEEGFEHYSTNSTDERLTNGVTSHLTEGSEDGRKRTKRKKEKKKPAGFKAEAERRFETVVEQLKSQDADGLWVSLGSCDIHDASIATLTEALASNTTVTALDLSRNNITSEGAKALFEALSDGAASDLIELDMRGNPFSSGDFKSLAHLWSVRKQLSVLVGAPKSPEPAVSISPFALRANKIEEKEEEELEDYSVNGNGYTSPLILQFFQMGNDETKPTGEAVEPQEPEEDPEVVAERLWDQVEHELQEDVGTCCALSDALREIGCAIQVEMAGCQLPMLDSTCADDLKPHTLHAFIKLHLLPGVLDRVPPPVIWPTSCGTPQAAVGSHRLAVAEIAALLVGAGAVVLDEAVASTGIVPDLVHLCFAHPANNALHACTLKLLRAAMSSKIADLWRPLLEQGMGTSVFDAAGSGQAGSWPPLQRQLAAVGIAVADMPQGRRPPLSGFAVAVAALLQTHSRDGLASGILQERLQGDEEWRDFTEEGGALQRLLQEQDGGDLGGPRPRTQPKLDGGLGYGGDGEDASATAAPNGSYMFNCRELMGMLRHMPQLSVSPRG
ncbi:g4046 [Coccomyxa elongata]